MDTKFVCSSDGVRIAYHIRGSGPALLLLHGFSDDRGIWSKHGWLDRLQSDFTLVSVDLRGCGESTGQTDPTAYTVERHLTDLMTVMDACELHEFRVWGWSFGASMGLHLAARSSRVIRAVIAGTYFGRIFTDAFVQTWVERIAPLAHAKEGGTLDELDLSPQWRAFAERTNLAVYLARIRGLLSWPGVEPREVRSPALICTGTDDGNVVVRLEEQRPGIEAAGLELHVFEGLAHIQLLSEPDTVYPVVQEFLRS
jgi:pimeloyl-ACP methyl ester carboxylesterase